MTTAVAWVDRSTLQEEKIEGGADKGGLGGGDRYEGDDEGVAGGQHHRARYR